jgi:hypothetical protein
VTVLASVFDEFELLVMSQEWLEVVGSAGECIGGDWIAFAAHGEKC